MTPTSTQPGAFDRFQATRIFGSLDGLRALSILAVLWHHTARAEGGSLLAGRGFLGVDLFFVISGFLIVTLLLREQRRTGAISLRGFYLRRCLRIFPPYYLMLLVVGLMAWLRRGESSEGVLRDLPFALLYASNLVPMSSLLAITWSLAAEEQFYLLAPALQKFGARLVPLLLPVLYVLVSLPPFGLFPEWRLPEFFRQTTFGPILLGVMLAHALDRRAGFDRAWRWLGDRWTPLAAAALLLAALLQPATDVSGWPRLLIHGSMGLLLASCVVREGHLLEPLLHAWPMRRIGVVSYGIYLYHLLVLHFVGKALLALGVSATPLVFLANGLCAWLVAELSFRFFEAPIMALRPRPAADRRQVACAPAPAG
jgi:peptidoglycan/LPS O-acetylase OafA/YrhL